jgi:hypothetical protein
VLAYAKSDKANHEYWSKDYKGYHCKTNWGSNPVLIILLRTYCIFFFLSLDFWYNIRGHWESSCYDSGSLQNFILRNISHQFWVWIIRRKFSFLERQTKIFKSLKHPISILTFFEFLTTCKAFRSIQNQRELSLTTRSAYGIRVFFWKRAKRGPLEWLVFLVMPQEPIIVSDFDFNYS